MKGMSFGAGPGSLLVWEASAPSIPSGPGALALLGLMVISRSPSVISLSRYALLSQISKSPAILLWCLAKVVGSYAAAALKRGTRCGSKARVRILWTMLASE